jgi:lysophospholipase L1-like esterase
MRRSGEFFTGLMLSIISIVIVAGICEALLRVALFSDNFSVPELRQSWRYADSVYDDDYWKLAFLFNYAARAQRVGHVDSELGWAIEKSPDNPLGLVSDTPYRIEDIERPILFYGDSFVAGASPIPDRIPQVMDRLLPEVSVLNYGVGGYGVDQIYLRYAETVGGFRDPVVLVGILTSDLDRSILGMRTGQKPYFDILNGQLVRQNLPILPTTREYIDRYPPEIKSYFFRFVMFRLRSWLPEEWFDRLYGYSEKHQRKLAVNSKILQVLKQDASKRELSLGVVIFYSQEELSEASWRVKFLQETLQALEIPYFDTRLSISGYVEDNRMTLDDLYYPDNGHPNELGNKVIAEGLTKWLNDLKQ